jgi:energy-coupling factor transporter ATP-binding protein EcfA2
MDRTDALVSVEDVTRKFPLDHNAVTALNQVSLQVDAGEFLAIAGPSGSGKSTLLNLIGCIDKPTSGRILINGINTGTLSPGRTTQLRREKIPSSPPAKMSSSLCSSRVSARQNAADGLATLSKASVSLPAPISVLTCSLAASANGSPSPAPSFIVPRWSWLMSLLQISTRTTPHNLSA